MEAGRILPAAANMVGATGVAAGLPVLVAHPAVADFLQVRALPGSWGAAKLLDACCRWLPAAAAPQPCCVSCRLLLQQPCCNLPAMSRPARALPPGCRRA
jgi:hypothetical protein